MDLVDGMEYHTYRKFYGARQQNFAFAWGFCGFLYILPLWKKGPPAGVEYVST